MNRKSVIWHVFRLQSRLGLLKLSELSWELLSLNKKVCFFQTLWDPLLLRGCCSSAHFSDSTLSISRPNIYPWVLLPCCSVIFLIWLNILKTVLRIKSRRMNSPADLLMFVWFIFFFFLFCFSGSFCVQFFLLLMSKTFIFNDHISVISPQNFNLLLSLPASAAPLLHFSQTVQFCHVLLFLFELVLCN